MGKSHDGTIGAVTVAAGGLLLTGPTARLASGQLSRTHSRVQPPRVAGRAPVTNDEDVLAVGA